jgi:hypothetical protein
MREKNLRRENEYTKFIPLLNLVEGFFHEEVEPVMKSHYPRLQYSAALIGSGSEVLGFDNETSMDHHWGLRVMLFLKPEDFESKRDTIREILSLKLPPEYRGFSTNFSPPDPNDNGVQIMQRHSSGPVNHRVDTFTIEGFFKSYLNIHIDKELEPVDWLTLPQQKLHSVTAGRVFRDDLGLENIRARLAWYPHDVWLYILASAWMRIGQEEHLMGRAGSVGDEIGSALIGSRLVRDIMRLVFLMEKIYAPYPKWFGTAFSSLKSAGELTPALLETLHSTSWQDREKHLCVAYKILAGMHNSQRITEPLSTEVTQFFTRPFKIIQGERFARAIYQQIKDPKVLAFPQRSLIGNIDLLSDNTELLMDELFQTAVKGLYERQGE